MDAPFGVGMGVGENIKMKKLLLILLLIPFVYSLEECRGTITQEQSPCFVLLPVDQAATNCRDINVTYRTNASTFLYNQSMDTFNSFLCNSTFNQTIVQTYTFLFTPLDQSFSDSGSIIVEVGNVNFFNLLVYLVFMAIILVLIIFMHTFSETSGSSVVYGWMATAVGVILGSIVLSPNFEVIKDVIFFIDVDLFLALLSYILALYTAAVSINIRRSTKPVEDEM